MQNMIDQRSGYRSNPGRQLLSSVVKEWLRTQQMVKDSTSGQGLNKWPRAQRVANTFSGNWEDESYAFVQFIDIQIFVYHIWIALLQN